MRIYLATKEEKEDGTATLQRIVEDSIILRIPICVEITTFIVPNSEVPIPSKEEAAYINKLDFIPDANAHLDCEYMD